MNAGVYTACEHRASGGRLRAQDGQSQEQLEDATFHFIQPNLA